jgi:hypothetical protein
LWLDSELMFRVRIRDIGFLPKNWYGKYDLQ